MPRPLTAARIGTAVAMVVFLLLATGGRPWDLFERGPFTSDFYDVQARALSRGHLDVPADVVAIEGFVVDGETHLYYGLAPALARLPIAALTEAANGRLVVVSQLAALAVACLAGARLLQRARRALDVDVPERWWQWTTGGFAAAIGLSTPLLWLSSRAIVVPRGRALGRGAGAARVRPHHRVVGVETAGGPRVVVRGRCGGALDTRIVRDRTTPGARRAGGGRGVAP